MFQYDYLDARRLLGRTVEAGDELGLDWRGEWERPELVRRGEGKRAIVVDVLRDGRGRALEVGVSLIEEGRTDGQPSPTAR